MDHYLTPEETDEFSALERRAARISELLLDLTLATVQAQTIDEGTKVNILNWIDRAEGFRGLAYNLHPQGEWQGGEVWKTRAPHICR